MFDPTPHINAVEHGLQDWLNKPTRDLLDQLGVDPNTKADDRALEDAAAVDAGAAWW